MTKRQFLTISAAFGALVGCGDITNPRFFHRDLPYLGIHDNRPGAEAPESSSFRRGSADSDPAISFDVANGEDELSEFFKLRIDEKVYNEETYVLDFPEWQKRQRSEKVVGSVYSYIFEEKRTNQSWDKSVALMNPALGGEEYRKVPIPCDNLTTNVLVSGDCGAPPEVRPAHYLLPYDHTNGNPLPRSGSPEATGTITYNMGVNVNGEPGEGRPIAFGITHTSTLDAQNTISEIWETDTGELVVRLDDGATGNLTLDKPPTNNSPAETILFENLSFNTEDLPENVGISHTIRGESSLEFPQGLPADGMVEGRYLNGVWYGRFVRSGGMSFDENGDIERELRSHIGVFAIGNGTPE